MTIPAVHLAEGLATDWWSIFGGRDREHSIVHYRTGFAIPDLSFKFDGDVFEVLWKQLTSENPKLSFLSAGSESLSRSDVESTLSGFIERVVDRVALFEFEQQDDDLRIVSEKHYQLDLMY